MKNIFLCNYLKVINKLWQWMKRGPSLPFRGGWENGSWEGPLIEVLLGVGHSRWDLDHRSYFHRILIVDQWSRSCYIHCYVEEPGSKQLTVPKVRVSIITGRNRIWPSAFWLLGPCFLFYSYTFLRFKEMEGGAFLDSPCAFWSEHPFMYKFQITWSWYMEILSSLLPFPKV